jgi:hypothetical protein
VAYGLVQVSLQTVDKSCGTPYPVFKYIYYRSLGIAVLYGNNSSWYIVFSVSNVSDLNVSACLGIFCLNSVYFCTIGVKGTEAMTSPF